jgi:hypothetical protein
MRTGRARLIQPAQPAQPAQSAYQQNPYPLIDFHADIVKYFDASLRTNDLRAVKVRTDSDPESYGLYAIYFGSWYGDPAKIGSIEFHKSENRVDLVFDLFDTLRNPNEPDPHIPPLMHVILTPSLVIGYDPSGNPINVTLDEKKRHIENIVSEMCRTIINKYCLASLTAL